MSKAKILQPDLVLGDVIINLSSQTLQQYQLKGLVLDVDETIVPFGQKEVSSEFITWIDTIKPIFPIWLVSNNISQNRIKNIADTVELPYLFGAGKPSRRKLRQAVDAMNLKPENVAMIGDRLFTDVLAGNRLGMFTILVEPMVHPDGKNKLFSLRNFEVWITEKLGVSLKS